ncbi:hypothetical protein [Rheinheimera nanhaiensis]|uniref:Lipoprotein n=1 Tax=Rheinheimera nanhaiensis E407-8 TaxID=562729 RepID=I1DVZ0_9GAMM|nr:hypothetical protein [Rheinheimera nanhaiensis]GAB58218.1 hypothetical protein RNAN_1189 [Rheinheimera nanhaiensis E407-8]
MIKYILKLTAVLSLSACAFSSSLDYTGSYTGDCYQLLKPSVLYKGWCANLSSSISTAGSCLGVQSLPIQAYDKEKSILNSFAQYQSDKEFWNEKLFGTSLSSSKYALVDKISANTQLQITNVIKKQWGTDGYFWAVRAKLLTGEYKGSVVTLPTYKFHLGNAWTKRPSTENFYLDSFYVKSCDAVVE